MATPFKTDSKREATASFGGYRYQAFQSVLAWMRLGKDEILVLEGAEDFDIHEPDEVTVTTAQIKNLSSNVTLRSTSVIDAINNYWTHCRRNPEHQIKFRFMTTANPGHEQGNPFGNGVKGIEYWERARIDSKVDLSPLKNFLLEQNLDQNLKDFIASNDGDALRDQLIRQINWDLGQKPKECLIYDIESRLITHGDTPTDKVSPHYARRVLLHLLHTVQNLMASEGDRRLRYSDFLTTFEEATAETIPHGELRQLRAKANAQAQHSLWSQHAVIRGPTALGCPIPLVDGAIPRVDVVLNLGDRLRQHRALFLQGSSGLGKTMLARVISDAIGGDWVWAGFRGRNPEQVRDLLTRANLETSALALPVQVVLDDLDLANVSAFEHEFLTLLFSVTNSDGFVIITGASECPAHLFPKVWLTEECKVSVPYFEEADITEMVRIHGMDDAEQTRSWAKLIFLTTSGHPQLVHARVRNLQAQGWPQPRHADLANPEDVQRVRDDARRRLLVELPFESARELGYRLSLITGSFSREMALFVAQVEPPISLPGEAFDVLVGPWIEREQDNRFRISPLISGAAGNVFSTNQIKTLHEAICISFIQQKKLNQYEIGTALSHAFLAKSGWALSHLAKGILSISLENIPPLEDGLFWLPSLSLDPGQSLYAENPVVDIYLRLAQFRIAAFGSKPETASKVICCILEAIERIVEIPVRCSLEFVAYGTILATQSVPIPSAIVVRMISRLLALKASEELPSEFADPMKELYEAIQLEGLSGPQALFLLEATRIMGLDDLAALLDALGSLDVEKRNTLLAVCGTDFDFAGLLVNGAWWKETRDGELDVAKAISVLKRTVDRGREWNTPSLVRAAFVAMSVIWDEYGNSREEALQVLEQANKQFPEDPNLKNQLAKILYHNNQFQLSLELSNTVLESPGDLSNVEAAFTCRSAGICAARLDDWLQAEELFQKGAEWAKQTKVLDLMAVGLKADAAFARWKQGRRKESVELYAQVLGELEKVPITDDLHNRHLHATVGACIAWTQNDIGNQNQRHQVEPHPGFCSIQEPHESMKDLKILPTDTVWGLLAGTEICLGLNLGISKIATQKMGDQQPTMILINNRIMAFNGIWERLDFDDFVTCLMEYYEAVQFSSALRQTETDIWEARQIPHLPEVYWQDQSNMEALHHHVIAAAVVMTARMAGTAIPVDRWRRDMFELGMLSVETERLLHVLSTDRTEATESLYDHAAYAVSLLRAEEHPAPKNLFMCFFWLLNALGQVDQWVSTSLEDIAVKHWTYAADFQRFAFVSPSTNCELIKGKCAEQTIHGYAKVAAILEVAAAGLRIQLSADSMEMLKELKAHGRILLPHTPR